MCANGLLTPIKNIKNNKTFKMTKLFYKFTKPNFKTFIFYKSLNCKL